MITVVRAQKSVPSNRAQGTFTGEVWVDSALPRRDGIGVADVFFMPGARTHWHVHEGGQLLIILSGEGLVGSDDGVVTVSAGDKIWTPPGVRHWHGASAGRYMVHTGISLAGVDWADAVTDDEYLAARIDEMRD
ncbi:quercetin dioxygenase-like cupin family protein [Actinoplanes lutulentus]|uniref:Quercetin dioxygenase-like cupin family protein n=1 Tax=Actinoplanes lutulentus TaxID=1287878 RepID=A0A327Z3J6_9ACTN|nr:cupin domain-containing protein [Actinoplanes lutulentus]MBB2946300.1 quercetin dioxygenase-like cupin family protein [Actinoplanes lutulentus]RAK28761.1 quercetin dioxygenase-like cupin family protein [Actinoplanes lutulentus]